MRKGAVVAIIIIAVLVIAAVIGIIVYNNSQSSVDDSGYTVGGNTGKTGSDLGFEEDQSDVKKESKKGVTIPGWEQITIDAGTTEVYVDLYNPESNEGNYYLTYELRLSDTDEVLYTSKLIEPGDHVKKITLNRPLEAGVYNAYFIVQPYNATTLAETNNAEVNFILKAV